MKKTNTVAITAASLFAIKGYTPDPANGKHYVVASDGKLNLLTVNDYVKKPIRAAIASATVLPQADVHAITGDYVIILDKKLQAKAKNPLTRKQVLAAIEIQNTIINRCVGIDTTTSENIVTVTSDDVVDTTLLDEVVPHLSSGKIYGHRAVKKAVALQNRLLMKSEGYAIRKLHKDFKKSNAKPTMKEAADVATVGDVVADTIQQMNNDLKAAAESVVTKASEAAARVHEGKKKTDIDTPEAAEA